jgi:O-antigen/teichoic acid export membrane protein
MSGIALATIVLTQLDKILLSRTLTLDDFGRYTLAGVIASGLYLLLTPMFNVIYPRMSTLVARNDTGSLLATYRNGTLILSSLLFPLVIFAALYSQELLQLWTGNAELAALVAPVASLLLAGTALGGVMHFPYALQLAYGEARMPLFISCTLTVVMAPLTIVLSLRYGAAGGATAWFVMNLLYLFFGTWITHRKLLPNEGPRWIVRDVAVPCATAAAVIGGGLFMIHAIGVTPASLGWGLALAILAFLVNIALLPRDAATALRGETLSKVQRTA